MKGKYKKRVEHAMADSNILPNSEGGRRGALSPMAWSMLAIFTFCQTAWLENKLSLNFVLCVCL